MSARSRWLVRLTPHRIDDLGQPAELIVDRCLV
jgi:hypothetical protein